MIQKPRRRGSIGHNLVQGDGAQAEEQQEEKKLYRIMMDARPGAEPWIYFTQQRGETWVNWDNALFLWIGDHLILLGLGVCALLGAFCWAVRSFVRRGGVKKGGYRRVSHEI